MTEDIDWENLFKPIDFMQGRIEYDWMQVASDRANSRFREIIEKYGRKIYQPSRKHDVWYERPNVFDSDHNSAILINVKRIEDE